VIKRAAHPYTRGLLNSLPSNPKYEGARRLEAIRGTVPDMIGLGDGCPFANRCPHVQEVCLQSFPCGSMLEPGHYAWCHFAGTV
jgi:oligopeptide transport system ATP-binding protein